MTYATSTPMNAPRKYNTIKTDAPDYLLAILSHYSSKFDGECLVYLPSIACVNLLHFLPPPPAPTPTPIGHSSIPQLAFFSPKKIETSSSPLSSRTRRCLCERLPGPHAPPVPACEPTRGQGPRHCARATSSPPWPARAPST